MQFYFALHLTFSTWNLSSPAGSRRGQDVDYAHKYKIIFCIQPRAWSCELGAESWEGGDVWRLGGSAAILRLSWQTCERCFTMFDMKTLVHGRVWFVKCASVSGWVGPFYKEKKLLINCSTLKSERKAASYGFQCQALYDVPYVRFVLS